MEKIEKKEVRIVLFIDLPNFLISAKQLDYETHKSFYKLLDLAKRYGKIQEGYAYGDFERLRIDFSIQHGMVSQNIRLIQCPGNPNGQGEGKIDDPMLIEGIHSTLRRDSGLFYILVSSDIMILPVSMTLRSLNKDFRVFGFSECASSLLKRLPEFIDLNRFLKKEDTYSPEKKNGISGKGAN